MLIGIIHIDEDGKYGPEEKTRFINVAIFQDKDSVEEIVKELI